MSLPAGQQRVLNRMEAALHASEPHLSSMYGMFARLSSGEPVTQEKVAAWRLRWLRSGSAIYAVVLIPVMFAAVIIGSLLGGNARGAATCDVGYSVGGGSPQTGRASCPPGTRPAAGITAAGDTTAPCPAASSRASQSGAGQSGAGLDGTAGQGTEPASRYVTLTGGEQAFSPPARAGSAASGTPPGVC
jgi:hypothetical protein